jgi:hypothetical protein
MTGKVITKASGTSCRILRPLLQAASLSVALAAWTALGLAPSPRPKRKCELLQSLTVS